MSGADPLSIRAAAPGTKAAPRAGMRILMMAAVVVALSGADVAQAQSLSSSQTNNGSPPSVADLHLAEKAAQKARKRLQQAPGTKSGSSWVHGGR